MSEEKVIVYKTGPELCGLLFIAFLVLKLCNVIDWSWWWVTVPLWGGLALVIAIFVVFFAIVGFLAFITGILSFLSKRRKG